MDDCGVCGRSFELGEGRACHGCGVQALHGVLVAAAVKAEREAIIEFLKAAQEQARAGVSSTADEPDVNAVLRAQVEIFGRTIAAIRARGESDGK